MFRLTRTLPQTMARTLPQTLARTLPQTMARPLSSKRRTPTLGQSSPTSVHNQFFSESGTPLAVNVTQRAADKLNAINTADSASNILRVLVESGGCHGYQYILGLKPDSSIDPAQDSVFERDGARFVLDKTSLEVLRDSTIDYSTELIGSQFKIVDSPYATSSCGCGSSFSFDPSSIPE